MLFKRLFNKYIAGLENRVAKLEKENEDLQKRVIAISEEVIALKEAQEQTDSVITKLRNEPIGVPEEQIYHDMQPQHVMKIR